MRFEVFHLEIVIHEILFKVHMKSDFFEKFVHETESATPSFQPSNKCTNH